MSSWPSAAACRRGASPHGIPNAPGKTVIQCNLDEFHINRIYPTHHAVLGDAKLTLAALTDAVSRRSGGAGRPAGNVVAEIRAARDAGLAEYREAMASADAPINPYRVFGDLMKVLDPHNSFVTHDSGNTRDQLSTVYDTLIPRGFLGWGNISTLGFGLAGAMAAKLAYPQRQSVAVTGDAGVGYMLGNLEVPVRQGLGITVAHIANGGFAGYGPGFWGDGHDPYTHRVLGPEEVNMSRAVAEMGLYAERVTEPADVVPALQRALTANDGGQPAYLEFICSQYPRYGGWASSPIAH